MLFSLVACDELRTGENAPKQKNVDEAFSNALAIIKNKGYTQGVYVITVTKYDKQYTANTTYYQQDGVFIKYFKKNFKDTDENEANEENISFEAWYCDGFEYIYNINNDSVEKLYYDQVLIENEVKETHKMLFNKLNAVLETEYNYQQNNAAVGPKLTYPEGITINLDKELLENAGLDDIYPKIEIYCEVDGNTFGIQIYIDDVHYFVTKTGSTYDYIFPENADVLARFFVE